MPSVASQAVHSSHHGHSPHGRATAPTAKEPETPFAQMLDQLGQPIGASEDQARGIDPAAAPHCGAASERTSAANAASGAKHDGKESDSRASDRCDGKAPNDASAATQTAAAPTDSASAAVPTDSEAAIDAGPEKGTDGDKDAATAAADDAAAEQASSAMGPEIGSRAAAAAALVTIPVLTSTPAPDDSMTSTADTASVASALNVAATAGDATMPVQQAGTDAAQIFVQAAGARAADAPSAGKPEASKSADASAQTETALTTDDAGDLPADTAAKVTPDQSKPRAVTKQPRGKADSDDGPDVNTAAELDAPAQAPAALGRRTPEARPSEEPASSKTEHRSHPAATGQAGDIALATGTPAPGSADAVQAATASPDGSQSAPAVGDRSIANAAPPSAVSAGNLPPAAVPIAGLAVEIAARLQAGSNHFEIRLDPPDLGRVEVRLDVDKSGHVNSRLVVDRPETLDLLRRDAGDLQRALQQAGLTTSDDGMQFSLRDHSFAGNGNGHAAHAARLIVPDADLHPAETAVAGYGRTLSASGGIDIRV